MLLYKHNKIKNRVRKLLGTFNADQGKRLRNTIGRIIKIETAKTMLTLQETKDILAILQHS